LNDKLERQLELSRTSGVVQWPAVVLNNVTYRGQFDAYDILEFICVSLISPSKQCNEIINGVIETPNNSGGDNSSTTVIVSIVVVIVLIVVFLLILVIYKRVLAREVQKDMSN